MTKPNTKIAMIDLIKVAREQIPFNLSFDGYCVGKCDRCPQKLLEFLDIEIADWESRLKKGITPNLGDVHALARNCKDVYEILEDYGLVQCKANNNAKSCE